MRGEGTTTKQMLEAPQGAVFVWVNHHFDHPKYLAKKHGREDLRIVSPSWFDDYRWAGLELTGIVVDHAAALTERQRENWHRAASRIRASVNGTGDRNGQ